MPPPMMPGTAKNTKIPNFRLILILVSSFSTPIGKNSRLLAA